MVTAPTEEALDKAEEIIRKLLVPVPDEANEHKRQQLIELATLNGTLHDNVKFGKPATTPTSASSSGPSFLTGANAYGPPRSHGGAPAGAAIDKEFASFMAEVDSGSGAAERQEPVRLAPVRLVPTVAQVKPQQAPAPWVPVPGGAMPMSMPMSMSMSMPMGVGAGVGVGVGGLAGQPYPPPGPPPPPAHHYPPPPPPPHPHMPHSQYAPPPPPPPSSWEPPPPPPL
jgi:hypothetical protein